LFLQIGIRPHFPDSRILSPRFVPFVPKPRPEPGKCLIVWSTARGDSLMEDRGVWKFARRYAGLAFPRSEQVHVAAAPLPGNPARVMKLGFAVLEDDLGRCR